MKRDGWLKDPCSEWVLRFRYDWECWEMNPMVFVEKGRPEKNGIALLKSRKRMRRELAKELWRNLLFAGWTQVNPYWE